MITGKRVTHGQQSCQSCSIDIVVQIRAPDGAPARRPEAPLQLSYHHTSFPHCTPTTTYRNLMRSLPPRHPPHKAYNHRGINGSKLLYLNIGYLHTLTISGIDGVSYLIHLVAVSQPFIPLSFHSDARARFLVSPMLQHLVLTLTQRLAWTARSASFNIAISQSLERVYVMKEAVCR